MIAPLSNITCPPRHYPLVDESESAISSEGESAISSTSSLNNAAKCASCACEKLKEWINISSPSDIGGDKLAGHIKNLVLLSCIIAYLLIPIGESETETKYNYGWSVHHLIVITFFDKVVDYYSKNLVSTGGEKSFQKLLKGGIEGLQEFKDGKNREANLYRTLQFASMVCCIFGGFIALNMSKNPDNSTLLEVGKIHLGELCFYDKTGYKFLRNVSDFISEISDVRQLNSFIQSAPEEKIREFATSKIPNDDSDLNRIRNEISTRLAAAMAYNALKIIKDPGHNPLRLEIDTWIKQTELLNGNTNNDIEEIIEIYNKVASEMHGYGTDFKQIFSKLNEVMNKKIEDGFLNCKYKGQFMFDLDGFYVSAQ